MGIAIDALHLQTESRRMSKKENMVVAAAVRWWVSKRPRDWDRATHLANPCANCTDHRLARAVAKFLENASNANQLLNEAEKDGHR